MNIIDYLKWRGDLTFAQSQFCQVDELIFSRLSYFDFSGLFNSYEEEITIEEAYERFSKKNNEQKRILIEGDEELFPLMAKSNRFKSFKLTRFVNNIVDEERTQFSAITIIISDIDVFVAFRGTDNTITGWREDLDMSFQDSVPCQIAGVDYLEQIASTYTTHNITVGGHSKGGNISIYASSFCSDLTKARIQAVYNNDGPGLSEASSNKQGYKDVLDKIHTYVPQSSVIGRMLSHKEKYTVVLSDEKGLMQHDVYSWQIEGSCFITLEEVDDGSVFVDDTLTDFLKDSSPEQRKKALDTVFELLYKTKATTIKEINKNKFENYSLLLKEYSNLDKETRQAVNLIAEKLFGSAKDVLIDKYNVAVEEQKEKRESSIENMQKQLKDFFDQKRKENSIKKYQRESKKNS